jgi:hypothetical protein
VSDYSAAGSVHRLDVLGIEGEGYRVSLVEALFFVGIDWAAKTHAVCVLDALGRQVAAFTVEHTAAWFAKLAARLAGLLELQDYPEDASLCPIAARRPLINTEPAPQTYIIGHPGGGEQVMLSVRDNRLLDADNLRLHYRTPTLGGNSGSPVFNRAWELIAVHHAGRTHMPRLNGRHGTYPANEGIWIDQVIRELDTALG